MFFTLPQKLFSFSRCLSFCLDFLVIQAKKLDLRDKINFKFYDVTTWLTTIAMQILTKISRRQSRNEFWSVNRI